MGTLQLIKLLVRRKEDKNSGDHFKGIQKNRPKPSFPLFIPDKKQVESLC